MFRAYVCLMTAFGSGWLAYKLYPAGSIAGFAVGPFSITFVAVATLMGLWVAIHKTG
jgi:hypothetical protein